MRFKKGTYGWLLTQKKLAVGEAHRALRALEFDSSLPEALREHRGSALVEIAQMIVILNQQIGAEANNHPETLD